MWIRIRYCSSLYFTEDFEAQKVSVIALERELSSKWLCLSPFCLWNPTLNNHALISFYLKWSVFQVNTSLQSFIWNQETEADLRWGFLFYKDNTVDPSNQPPYYFWVYEWGYTYPSSAWSCALLSYKLGPQFYQNPKTEIQNTLFVLENFEEGM